MRFFAYLLLIAAAAIGCGESAAGPDVGCDPSVDPGCDAPDGGVPDADLPDGDVPDGDVPDGGVPDAGVDAGLDAGLDGGLPDGGEPRCNTNALCPTCPDEDALCDAENPCPAGEICVPTGCDDLSRCFVTGGGACSVDQDCGNPAYECNQEIGRCLRTDGGCDDSNDCVAGFACEDNGCVDRRVPCEIPEDCPHGYACYFADPDQRFCRRISRPCDDDIDCLTLGVPCGDADGDGLFECAPSLTPNAPDAISCDVDQCPDGAAPVCEVTADGTGAMCGEFGLCDTPSDCAAGFDCRDLWGDGRKECVLPTGSCEISSDCAPREVCASPRIDGPPLCIAGASIPPLR